MRACPSGFPARGQLRKMARVSRESRSNKPGTAPSGDARKRDLHLTHPMAIIGWTEYIDFPSWAIRGLKAKVDTGARTSALHVDDLEDLGDGTVRFHVITSRVNPEARVEVTAPILKWARVRSSTGIYRKRCFVRARVVIGHVEKEIELSLVSREKMLFRMLLGRKAIEHDFLVDVGKRSVITEKPRPRKRESKS